MKIIVGLTLALTALPAIAAGKPAQPARLTVFEFRDFKAGVPVSADQLATCGAGDVVVCSDHEKVAGLPATTMIAFYKARLSSVTIMPDDAIYYDVIIGAFIQKYGRPCRSSVEKWRNGAGAVLDNPVYVWCFQSGRLIAKPFGYSLNSPSITYEDANKEPIKPTKADF